MRLTPKNRKKQILDTAVSIAMSMGYQKIRRCDIAKQIQISTTLISHYYLSIANLRNEILKAAIERKLFLIIAQGLSAGDPLALNISDELKQQTYKYICQ